MTRATLLALADRVEALTGPCRLVNREILDVLGTHVLEKRGTDRRAWWYLVSPTSARVFDPDAAGGSWPPRPPAYTASLDDAVTLVPEGWTYQTWQGPSGKPHEWHLRTIRDGDERYTEATSKAATEPLARTAAALRARAMMETE